jgi:hypothetical protein
MLTTETVEKALDLLDLGYTYPDIAKEARIASDDTRAVGHAYVEDQTEQLAREVQLAGVLELAAAKLRSGQGWDEATTGDVLGEVLHVYPAHVKKALEMALLAGEVLKPRQIVCLRVRAVSQRKTSAESCVPTPRTRPC